MRNFHYSDLDGVLPNFASVDKGAKESLMRKILVNVNILFIPFVFDLYSSFFSVFCAPDKIKIG